MLSAVNFTCRCFVLYYLSEMNSSLLIYARSPINFERTRLDAASAAEAADAAAARKQHRRRVRPQNPTASETFELANACSVTVLLGYRVP